jgi:L-rhamnose mutarotase
VQHTQLLHLPKTGIDGKPYLFSYFEYTGDDFGADMKKMAADTSTRKWWQETDPTQLPASRCRFQRKNLERYGGGLPYQLDV